MFAPLVRTGDALVRGQAVASRHGLLCAEGNVVCTEPVISPVTGTPCLFYSIRATVRWHEAGMRRQRVLDSRHEAARFALDDGSGAIWIDAVWGGHFEPMETTRQSKPIGPYGHIAGTDFLFGKYKLSTGALPRGAICRVEEHVLPLLPRLYARGKIESRGIGHPGWCKLFLEGRAAAH
ncbi:hypothetical protein [Pendulispora albinea]|uniref:E3 ubiquitin ligase family protein n=1 Tax=Pendulispora albinea TaxID=2741071 RepID=A0ABZ2M249_9BACT